MRYVLIGILLVGIAACGGHEGPPITDTTVTVAPGPFDYNDTYDAEPTNAQLQNGDEIYKATKGDGEAIYQVRAAGTTTMLMPGMRLVRTVQK